jgi:hypothetical protein
MKSHPIYSKSDLLRGSLDISVSQQKFKNSWSNDTSLSTPYVAGLFALLIGAYRGGIDPNKYFTASELRQYAEHTQFWIDDHKTPIVDGLRMLQALPWPKE